MNLHHSQRWELLVGDCRKMLRSLPAGSVRCCVTSPPYWGLRDYGNPPLLWGGDPQCDHDWGEVIAKTAQHSQVNIKACADKYAPRTNPRQSNCDADGLIDRGGDAGRFCERCEAWLGCLGGEPTPQMFVSHIVEVFREVGRVLSDDGTLWLNLGDCYANDGKWGGRTGGRHRKSLHGHPVGRRRRSTGLGPKNLVGVPWLVAFALQQDGWCLRSDIVWSKPNLMPESVNDRPTKSHEYVFLLAKSPKYFYDAEAVKTPTSGTAHPRGNGVNPKAASIDPGNHRDRPKQNSSFSSAVAGLVSTRNLRSVWRIATQAYPEAHFATFPEELPSTCIKAGSAVGDTVLDPFAGSGTTGRVAILLDRQFIGIEQNEEYAELARKRITAPIKSPLNDQAKSIESLAGQGALFE